MVIAFSVILIGLLLLIKPLQRNTFYVLHCAIVILSAYYVETHYFRIPPLLKNYSFILYYKTFLLFLVFHFVSSKILFGGLGSVNPPYTFHFHKKPPFLFHFSRKFACCRYYSRRFTVLQAIEKPDNAQSHCLVLLYDQPPR